MLPMVMRLIDRMLTAAVAARVVSAAAELTAAVEGQHGAHDVNQVTKNAISSQQFSILAHLHWPIACQMQVLLPT